MKLVLLLVLTCLGIGAAVLTRTLTIPVRKSDYKPEQGNHRAEEYAAKLSKMVKYDTTSYAFTDQRETFLGYHKILASLFPLVHERLEIIEIDGSLLFHYKGRSDRKPIVLMGHQDVVPAPEGWDRPPFSGEIANGKVYGRGSVDTKCSCMAFFQAAEELLAEEYLPEQDVWLSTSCTEEWGGPGCPALVEELQRRGVKPWLVCDEGGGIYTDPMMVWQKKEEPTSGSQQKEKADTRVRRRRIPPSRGSQPLSAMWKSTAPLRAKWNRRPGLCWKRLRRLRPFRSA